ncbi:MAG: hypothetical protein IJW49_04795 [Clostridia bacterium]|nr:hypothetical protein [Clostridia bacterium]
MKKTILFLLISILVISLISCGSETNESNNANPAYQAVINRIEAIKNISDASVDSRTKVDTVRSQYDALDDQAKAQVTNYDLLLKLERRIKFYSAREEAESEIKDWFNANLKNPSSLETHGTSIIVYCDTSHENPVLISAEVDYSAQNGFGGTNRETKYFYYKVSPSTFDGYYDLEEISIGTYLDLYEEWNVVNFGNFLW